MMTASSALGRPTWVEINLDCIASNVDVAKTVVGERTRIMAVVKADGYGHGAVQTAQTALQHGASYLGVALVEEGIALRKAGIRAPILVMGTIPARLSSDTVKYDLTATVVSYQSAVALSDAAIEHGRPVKVHVKVDTGMSRLGQLPGEALKLTRDIVSLPGVELEGLYTHFACADTDMDMTCRQLKEFKDLVVRARREGVDVPICHAANSAALIRMPGARLDMVRLGIAMYGLSPLGTVALGPEWKPALSFHTRVSFVKNVRKGTCVGYGSRYTTETDALIATLPVGYADGYSRSLSNKGEVLIRGKRYAVAGSICMDQLMIVGRSGDVVEVGDEAILIGSQNGDAIHAEDLARMAGTIAYETVCTIGKRVPRLYNGDAAHIYLDKEENLPKYCV